MVQIIRGDRVGKRGRLAVGCSAAVFGPNGQINRQRIADAFADRSAAFIRDDVTL